MDDTKDVQLLAFVLVDTLDLNIEKRRRVDLDAIVLHDVLRESHLVGVLDVPELLTELLVVNKRLKLVQQGKEIKPWTYKILQLHELQGMKYCNHMDSKHM